MKLILFLTTVTACFLLVVTDESGVNSITREKRARTRTATTPAPPRSNARKTITVNLRNAIIRHYSVANPQDEAAVEQHIKKFPYYFLKTSGQYVHQFPNGDVPKMEAILQNLLNTINEKSDNYEWKQDKTGAYNLKSKNGKLVIFRAPPSNNVSVYDTINKDVYLVEGEIIPKFLISTRALSNNKVEAYLHYDRPRWTDD